MGTAGYTMDVRILFGLKEVSHAVIIACDFKVSYYVKFCSNFGLIHIMCLKIATRRMHKYLMLVSQSHHMLSYRTHVNFYKILTFGNS